MPRRSRFSKFALRSLPLLALLTIGNVSGFARDKYETLTAQAFGTSTQMGQTVSVTVIIYEFSAPEDRQVLVDAFTKGQNQGLVNALEKLPAVGRIAITGTLGYDLSYIREIPTPTGRKIRFVTNRPIRFGEAYFDTQSQAFNLSAGEIDLNDQDKTKSAGVVYPAAQLGIGDDGQLTLNLLQNPWRLGNIIDWKGTPGEN